MKVLELETWLSKSQALAGFKDGWNSYSAPAPAQMAIDVARLYLEVLQETGLEPHRVEASVMGGVGITHRQGERKVYVEFYNDGTAHALLSDRTAAMRTLPVTPTADGFRQLIAEAWEYLDG